MSSLGVRFSWSLAVAGCSGALPLVPLPTAETTTADTAPGPEGRCGDGLPEPGELCFEPLVTHVAAGPSRRLDAGDLDGDGRLDLVTVFDGLGGLLSALSNDGSGGFVVASTASLPAADVRFAHADTDGVPDLFVAGIPLLGNAVVFGDGDALLPPSPVTYYYWSQIERGLPVDWDGDGVMDVAIVVPSKTSGVHVGSTSRGPRRPSRTAASSRWRRRSRAGGPTR